ncbi:hypothetical protein GCM10025868_37340 [Angustibacter aerolatus]|uniref:DUF3152 domain-containing protein n=1 Tax=Angustibacter aerolatus TaxID=1162965 RepID=A0ABQ6JKT2_9ACTN|nr:DUF3152 domain-containing protein [Angustibacter aerolatus]GMA88484.1 hypothetical protein GCM10025868_37340 [Angustibacter aerolatus]
MAFADAVMATLNDPRSWGHGGRMTFARTDGRADITVVLASPDTSARLCRPLVTRGRLSCSIGGRAVLTSYRWALATPEFDSVAQYRQYVVNHEVGHALGHHHEFCGERGEPGPGDAAADQAGGALPAERLAPPDVVAPSPVRCTDVRCGSESAADRRAGSAAVGRAGAAVRPPPAGARGG